MFVFGLFYRVTLDEARVHEEIGMKLLFVDTFGLFSSLFSFTVSFNCLLFANLLFSFLVFEMICKFSKGIFLSLRLFSLFQIKFLKLFGPLLLHLFLGLLLSFISREPFNIFLGLVPALGISIFHNTFSQLILIDIFLRFAFGRTLIHIWGIQRINKLLLVHYSIMSMYIFNDFFSFFLLLWVWTNEVVKRFLLVERLFRFRFVSMSSVFVRWLF